MVSYARIYSFVLRSLQTTPPLSAQYWNIQNICHHLLQQQIQLNLSQFAKNVKRTQVVVVLKRYTFKYLFTKFGTILNYEMGNNIMAYPFSSYHRIISVVFVFIFKRIHFSLFCLSNKSSMEYKMMLKYNLTIGIWSQKFE